MAYEDDGASSLPMPFLLYFFVVFSHNFIRQDKTFLKKSDDFF